MPELPDVAVYQERIAAHFLRQPLQDVRVAVPFLLRTFDPPLSAVRGKRLMGVSRIGKRLVLALEDDVSLVLHLMIAGRLRPKPRGIDVPKKVGLAAFDFPEASLLLTEASSKKRASLHVVRGTAALAAFDRGGVEPLDCSEAELASALKRENRTLKRALTDPRIVSGVGNAYSDEILFWAGLSPVKRTAQLDASEIARLHGAMRETLTTWIERLRREVGDGFPDKVTAFHDKMAVHGRFQKPCLKCATSIQRVRFANNELDYCPRCQTNGRLLADRALSRLLGADFPKRIEDLEERAGAADDARESAKRAGPRPRSSARAPRAPRKS